MIINGVNYAPDELEHHFEKEFIQGAVPGFFCCFSTLPHSSDTEEIVVAYLPSVEENDTRARIGTRDRIVDVIGLHTSSSAIVLPLTVVDLKPSALGKLPRGAIKSAFEKGAYAQQLLEANEGYRRELDLAEETVSPLEKLIRHEIHEYFQVKGPYLSIGRSMFLLGATSMDLIKIGRLISNRLQLRERLTLSQVLRNPTPQGLAIAIEGDHL
ncbi:uncharacterized protein BDZ83DRAFT_793738 [Colletotrichum acutatum]|uniref:Carrier domain-containing protein n=1 Tax=Glomerella acutata TaxID=27357 RepID=A0AAD8ULK8_GLOAC|nr:uncharacterized protein BDZ83DRAFT_793738 [Colletotrichum acutatum]KAK1723309.1 hypothetical protein BDZ83DRAFT_793738 [Colletotrichum acutatum]